MAEKSGRVPAVLPVIVIVIAVTGKAVNIFSYSGSVEIIQKTLTLSGETDARSIGLEKNASAFFDQCASKNSGEFFSSSWF